MKIYIFTNTKCKHYINHTTNLKYFCKKNDAIKYLNNLYNESKKYLKANTSMEWIGNTKFVIKIEKDGFKSEEWYEIIEQDVLENYIIKDKTNKQICKNCKFCEHTIEKLYDDFLGVYDNLHKYYCKFMPEAIATTENNWCGQFKEKENKIN